MPKALPSPLLDDDVLDSWQLALSAAGRQQETIRSYVGTVQDFRMFLSPDGTPGGCTTRVGSITQEECQRYLVHLLGIRTQTTTRLRYQHLKLFFAWCLDEEILPDPPGSPMRKVKAPVISNRPVVEILSDEQVHALLATCERDRSYNGIRDYALLRVLLATGMRRAECVNLTLSDVDTRAGTIAVRRGKGGRGRVTAIDVQTARALDRYIKRARATHRSMHLEALWLGQQGPITWYGIRFILERRASQAGLEHLHLHLFRHFFAHEAMAQHMEVNDVAELLGHSNLSMIMETYGKKRANERAIKRHHDRHIGDRW